MSPSRPHQGGITSYIVALPTVMMGLSSCWKGYQQIVDWSCEDNCSKTVQKLPSKLPKETKPSAPRHSHHPPPTTHTQTRPSQSRSDHAHLTLPHFPPTRSPFKSSILPASVARRAQREARALTAWARSPHGLSSGAEWVATMAGDSGNADSSFMRGCDQIVVTWRARDFDCQCDVAGVA